MEYMTVIGAEVTEKSVLPIKNGKEISIFVTKDNNSIRMLDSLIGSYGAQGQPWNSGNYWRKKSRFGD